MLMLPTAERHGSLSTPKIGPPHSQKKNDVCDEFRVCDYLSWIPPLASGFLATPEPSVSKFPGVAKSVGKVRSGSWQNFPKKLPQLGVLSKLKNYYHFLVTVLWDCVVFVEALEGGEKEQRINIFFPSWPNPLLPKQHLSSPTSILVAMPLGQS